MDATDKQHVTLTERHSRELRDPNPWKTMWLQPRRTVRWLVENDPARHVFLLAALSGFAGAIDRAMVQSLGAQLQWPGIVLISAIIGPIFGVIGLLIGSWLLRLTGGWIGGQGKTQDVITAYAWSNLPSVAGLILLPIQLGLYGQELFLINQIELAGIASAAWLLFGLIKFVLIVWGIGLLLLGLSEVHRFSVWKAVANCLITIVIVGVLLFLLRAALIAMGMGAQG